MRKDKKKGEEWGVKPNKWDKNILDKGEIE